MTHVFTYPLLNFIDEIYWAMSLKLKEDAEMITFIKRNIFTEWSVTLSREKFDAVNLLKFRKPLLFESKLIEAVYMWLIIQRISSIEEDYLCDFWTCAGIIISLCFIIVVTFSSNIHRSNDLTNSAMSFSHCPFYGEALWFSLAEQGLRLTVDTPLSEHGGIRIDNMISLLWHNYNTFDYRHLL